MNNNTPYFWFGEFCEKNKFRFCDIHSLRHLHASLLINAGVDMVSVSSDMGHSCVGTTVNHSYGHTTQSSYIRNKSNAGEILSFTCVLLFHTLSLKSTLSRLLKNSGYTHKLIIRFCKNFSVHSMHKLTTDVKSKTASADFIGV